MFGWEQGILSTEAAVASIKQLEDTVGNDLRGNGTKTVEICLIWKGNRVYPVASLAQYRVHSHLDGRIHDEAREDRWRRAGQECCPPKIRLTIRSQLYSSEQETLIILALIREYVIVYWIIRLRPRKGNGLSPLASNGAIWPSVRCCRRLRHGEQYDVDGGI